MRFASPGDESAFFSWLHAIPAVVSARGEGRELHIRLRSARLSAANLREFIALYDRYDGNMKELAQFVHSSNESWFKSRSSFWYSKVFGR
jgi:hypothetical protein